MPSTDDLQARAINTLRFLAADAIQNAHSGHPGLPMGAAALAYTLWTRHLRINPKHPEWPGRDRFILSGGHGSMLLYGLLHLTGYDLSLDEIKNFRQWGSLTPGHPELGVTPGVEVTTGPLGQGFSNGVGMAIVEAHLASLYNRPGYPVVDYYIYAIVTDGDLMEGVASEAASLAGHLRLGRLIYLYDDNRISIEGSTDRAFTEERSARFEAYGWQVLKVADGNDVEAIDQAIQAAKKDPRPSLIVCRTHIGFGLPTRQDTEKAHGEPPGDEELAGAKRKLGWPVEPRFYIPEDVLAFYRNVGKSGEACQADWKRLLESYRKVFPDLATELARRLKGRLPKGWEKNLPEFKADTKGVATRVASGKVLNAVAAGLPDLMGGSADLAPSTNTWLKDYPSFQPDTPQGRNLQFGVREHAMGAIVNGMASQKAVVPYGATFLVFSDYMRPAIRLSAFSHLPSIWVFTHDSIGLGEDGPTHQPVEQLASLRLIPGLSVIRPADGAEVAEAWCTAINRRNGPTALILARQSVPTLDRSILSPAKGLQRGAYILADIGDQAPDLILMASGSEVALIVEAGFRLAAEGKNVRLVSFPSWDLFLAQEQAYRERVLPPKVRARLAVEAGVTTGWEKWVGEEGVVIGLDRFGASAPGKVLMDQFGFTIDHILEQAGRLLALEENNP
ncbi:MAG: transketolase [Chloroflexi bacterium]|nr:transketolase [Chloroflexota bacterium]